MALLVVASKEEVAAILAGASADGDDDDDEEDEDQAYHPEFTHQIFGDSEKIFGYDNLCVSVRVCVPFAPWFTAERLLLHLPVQVFFSACRLKAFIHIEFETRVPEDAGNDVPPADDIEAILRELLSKQGVRKSLGVCVLG